MVTKEIHFLQLSIYFHMYCYRIFREKICKIISHVRHSGIYEYNLMISFHITLGKNFKEVTVSVDADVLGDVTCDTSVVHVSLYLFSLAFHHREKNWGE